MEDKNNSYEIEDVLSDILDEEIKCAPVVADDLFMDLGDLEEIEEQSQADEVKIDELQDVSDISDEKAEISEEEWLDDLFTNYDYDVSEQKVEDETDNLLDFLDNQSISGTFHPWRISLYEKLPFICEDFGTEKVFLIGYNNGQMARKKETHFEQHETDPIPYIISLDPDPHFVSYSFFYGFFRETLEKMCVKNYSTEELRVSIRKKTVEDFFSKYTFDFRNNPKMIAIVKEYVETMVENIVDSMEKREG